MRFIIMLAMLLVATTAQASTVALQWDAVTDTDLAGYKVYYQSDSSTLPFMKVQPVAKGVTTATITGLDPTRTYYFAVTAFNTVGTESAYSNILTVPRFPTTPANVKAISILISQ